MTNPPTSAIFNDLETEKKKRTQNNNNNKYIVYIDNPLFRNPCVISLPVTSYLQHGSPFLCDYERTGFM